MLKKKINFRNPKILHPILIVGMGAILFVLVFQKVVIPNRQRLKSLQEKEQLLQTELNKIWAMKTRFKALQTEVETANHKLDSLREVFPDQKEIPKLIKEITKVARASNIITVKFIPLPDIIREYYKENRYNIAVIGGYHDLAEFFSFLANLPLIINLSNVKMTAFSSGKSASDEAGYSEAEKTITASFDMTTFSSKR